MSTFDDDNEAGLFEEPRRRPPRESARRPQRPAPRRKATPAGPNFALRLAGLVVVAIAIVFGLVLSCSGSSKSDYTSYITAMQPLAQESASVGDQLATAMVTPGLTFDTFTAKLDEWVQLERSDYIKAQRLRPPGPLQSAHAEALATFYLREAALTNLASHLDTAHQRGDSSYVAAPVLAADAQLFSTSDVVWDQLYKQPATGVLAQQGVTGVIVPVSKIVTNPNIVSEQQLRIVYQRLRTPTSGGHVAGLHGSALVATNVVEDGTTKTLSTTSGVTVTCCGNLIVNVVFANSGSYPEVQIPVTLTVEVAGHQVYTHTVTVPQIAVGGQATAAFTDVQVPPSAFGHQDTISVSIAKVHGEAKLDNNQASYPVFFRLSTS